VCNCHSTCHFCSSCACWRLMGEFRVYLEFI
jgi:hypothetical protein